MMLLVGLGNPNPNNSNNRHNVGFLIIDAINEKFKLSKQKPKFKGLLTTGKINEQKVFAIKPLTFMNSSGICIKEDHLEVDLKQKTQISLNAKPSSNIMQPPVTPPGRSLLPDVPGRQSALPSTAGLVPTAQCRPEANRKLPSSIAADLAAIQARVSLSLNWARK